MCDRRHGMRREDQRQMTSSVPSVAIRQRSGSTSQRSITAPRSRLTSSASACNRRRIHPVPNADGCFPSTTRGSGRNGTPGTR